jgi:aromatic-L-amino-acid decarboxylase
VRAAMDERFTRLEPALAELDSWLGAAARFALEQIAGLPSAPATGPVGAAGAAIADEVSRPIGEEPLAGGLAAALALLARASEASLNAAGPGYLAYIPGGGLPSAAIADLLACTLNRYTGISAPAPALFRLETDVLMWLAREVGYGPAARGLLTSGGSLATFGAVVAARHRRFGDSGELGRAVAYTSAQAHHSVAKAVRLAGVPAANVRLVEVDDAFRLRPDRLAAALAADRAAGNTPFLVVAAAGTTNTGAIDPLPAIAEVCADAGVWLHVDAAYGGAFVLCEEGRRRLAGIGRADSIALDPHKGMFLPYGTGCLLVAEGEHLRRAHDLGGSYLQDLEGAGTSEVTWSPAALGPELSRDFRGLRLWLPLMLHGAGAFRAALAEKLALAERFAAGLDELRGRGAALELVARPQLSVVAFRLARQTGEELVAWNQRNRAFLAAINARQRVLLSSTQLPVAGGEAFTLRVCVLSFRTHARDLDRCLEDVMASLPPVPPG